MLGFVEEIVLLQLGDTRGGAADPPSVTQIVLAGAALMELALRDRVDADIERLFVVDPTPTGDDILDDVLRHLAAAGTEFSAVAAIEWIASQAAGYQGRVLERLVAQGLLREENGQLARILESASAVKDSEQREVKARLRQILLTDEIPEPRAVVLICLIEACGLLHLLLDPDEIAKTATRVEQLTRLDLIGHAVTQAVAEIRFFLKHWR